MRSRFARMDRDTDSVRRIVPGYETALYGFLTVFAVLLIRGRIWRSLVLLVALLVVMLVGLSRIALGAHYLIDVLAAIASHHLRPRGASKVSSQIKTITVSILN